MSKKNRTKDAAKSIEPKAGESQARLLPWIVAALAVVAFLPALGNGFVNWDDDANFLINPDYRGLAPANLDWMFSTFLMGHYHPLTWITLGFDYVLWGMSPAGYHLTNILIHAGAAVFVYLLFLELLRLARREERASRETQIGAAFGALVFAVHPLRVESVAWISERRDVLCGLFYAATLYFYVRGRKLASIAMFAAALLSKVLAATLAPVLLILDLYPLRKQLTVRLLLEKAPYFALALAAGLNGIGRYDESMVPGAVGHDEFYLGLRIALSLYGVAFYVWKTLVPLGIYPQYVFDPDPSPLHPVFLFAGVAVIVITAAVFVFRKRYPFLLAAWAAYAITLIPVLSFLRLDRQNYVADHHTYVATLSLAVVAGGLLAAFVSQPRARNTAAACVVALVSLTLLQTATWRDSVTLWSRAVEGAPMSIVAHNNLGRAYVETGNDDRAVEEFRKAIEIRSDYPHAHYNLGSVLMRRGELTEAEQHFRESAASLPSAQTLSDWGNCLLRQERAEEAIEKYAAALEVRPNFPNAHFNMALALHHLRRLDEARERYQRAVELDPGNAEARRRLAELVGR